MQLEEFFFFQVLEKDGVAPLKVYSFTLYEILCAPAYHIQQFHHDLAHLSTVPVVPLVLRVSNAWAVEAVVPLVLRVSNARTVEADDTLLVSTAAIVVTVVGIVVVVVCSKVVLVC